MTLVATNTMLIALSAIAQAAWDVVAMIDAALATIVAAIAANVELLCVWLWTLGKMAAVVAIVALVMAQPMILVGVVLIAAYGMFSKKVIGV